ncbi:hypothetical protein E3O06_16510 [Cryobacterium glaciale]|uniref:Uncharacterized protein n=1 Tax=Cryobacterium glaciale TaxID=1259145 RepID=A0A4R8UPD7_9MICO|nr:hypothetical protein [Cryobacterium glaciale]TFB68110.1 hypothetical protein E3O06_16510 [Cryobacterium glaciale]
MVALTQMKAIVPLVYLVMGMLSAIVGLLPWLVTGMRLPLQNLWAVNTLPEDMPIVLLPFSQYTITLIVAVIVTGSALAGGLARVTRAQHPRFTLAAIVVGVLTVQVVAIVQTAVTTAVGLTESPAAKVYLFVLTAGTLAASLIGLLILALIARAPVAGAMVAVSLAAVASSAWLNGFIAHPLSFEVSETARALLNATRWVPAVIVGLAVAWGGLATIGRVAGAVVSFLALWIGPTLFTAVSAAAGTRVLAAYPAEMLDYGAQVFVSALGVKGGSASLLIPAVIVMVLGLAVRWALRRRRLQAALA